VDFHKIRGPEKSNLGHLLNPVTSLLCYALFTGSTTERIEYKLLSLTYKVLTPIQPPDLIISSLLNLLETLALHLSPLSLDHQHHRPAYNLILVPLSLSLPVHVPTTSSQSSVYSPLSPSISLFLFYYRFETYPFHNSFPPQALFRMDGWTFSSEHLGFCSQFLNYSVFFGSVRQIKLAIRQLS